MEIQFYYVVTATGQILFVSSCYIDEIEEIVDLYNNVGCEIFATTEEKFDIIERSTKSQEVAEQILGFNKEMLKKL